MQFVKRVIIEKKSHVLLFRQFPWFAAVLLEKTNHLQIINKTLTKH